MRIKYFDKYIIRSTDCESKMKTMAYKRWITQKRVEPTAKDDSFLKYSE